MFREMNLVDGKPEKTTRDFGQTKLPCIQFRRAEPSNSNMTIILPSGLAVFCFEPNSLMLRYSKGGMSATTERDENRYQKIVRFQNRYVPSEVVTTRGGKKFLEMHVEKLEMIPEVKLADFTPPPGALSIRGRITVDNKVLLLDYLLHEETPKYPQSNGKRGAATVKFVIRRDGRVADVQFVDGSSEMRKPLENAMQKFVYRPFVVMGEPAEVEASQSFSYETH